MLEVVAVCPFCGGTSVPSVSLYRKVDKTTVYRRCKTCGRGFTVRRVTTAEVGDMTLKQLVIGMNSGGKE